ncbi:hypothetical protein [Streptosporangium sp. NPDC051022]|uniref:hypothetical protein n=1 Tax=Streptosporangium sp. NPDC051022 TaxID=3155752 RepID=UPI0034146711
MPGSTCHRITSSGQAERPALSPDARGAAYTVHFLLVYGDQVMADPDHAATVAATLRAGSA